MERKTQKLTSVEEIIAEISASILANGFAATMETLLDASMGDPHLTQREKFTSACNDIVVFDEINTPVDYMRVSIAKVLKSSSLALIASEQKRTRQNHKVTIATLMHDRKVGAIAIALESISSYAKDRGVRDEKLLELVAQNKLSYWATKLGII